jgi:hypothetical protein
VKEHSFTPEQKPKSVWPTRIGGGLLCLAILTVLITFYRQEAGTKFIMIHPPTVHVVIEIESTATITTTPTRTPSPIPSITPTGRPVYGESSPQPIMVVPKWTPTPMPTRVTEQNTPVPCNIVTPSKYADILCVGDIEKT